MNYTLPETVEIGGAVFPIMWDYRPILDIISALQDPDLDDQGRLYAALYIFYPRLEDIYPEDMEEAAKKMFWFINGGSEENKQSGPKLMDWEQDFPLIIAPINRVMGRDVRQGRMETAPLHWWTLLSAYYEIGDCTFAQVVRIRDMQARGKKLDKQDQEWLRRNRELVTFKNKYTQKDQDRLKDFLGI